MFSSPWQFDQTASLGILDQTARGLVRCGGCVRKESLVSQCWPLDPLGCRGLGRHMSACYSLVLLHHFSSKYVLFLRTYQFQDLGKIWSYSFMYARLRVCTLTRAAACSLAPVESRLRLRGTLNFAQILACTSRYYCNFVQELFLSELPNASSHFIYNK
jgi:hypothetical protein